MLLLSRCVISRGNRMGGGHAHGISRAGGGGIRGTTLAIYIRVITKLPNSEQSYKGKVKTHNYINRQNQSTTGKL